MVRIQPEVQKKIYEEMIKVITYADLDIDLLSMYSSDVYIPFKDDINEDNK